MTAAGSAKDFAQSLLAQLRPVRLFFRAQAAQRIRGGEVEAFARAFQKAAPAKPRKKRP